MTAASPTLLSHSTHNQPAPSAAGPVRVPRTWAQAVGDGVSFALVGVASVGSILETLDYFTDNPRGIVSVSIGATVGATASAVYARLETSTERLARVRLAAWALVRFYVAFEMMRYGTAKLVNMQFYERYYFQDTRPADMTPMALAWTFFGRTYGYQAVSGVVEVASAVLLCFRRTAALGACVLLAAMTNIVLLNFFYDVPVKLFSSIYLVMGLYILSPDARRFWTFFVGDGPVPPRAYLARDPARPRRPVAMAFVVALVLGLPAADIVHKAAQRQVFHTDPLEGAWVVEDVAGLDGVLDVQGRWDKVFFEKGEYGFVQIGSQRVRFDMKFDEAARTLRMFDFGAPKGTTESDGRELTATFEAETRRLHLRGSHDGTPFSVELRRELPR